MGISITFWTLLISLKITGENMSDAKLPCEKRRDVIVSMLIGAYPKGMSRAYLINLRFWKNSDVDNALHVLKKRSIVFMDGPEYVLRTAPDSYNQKIKDQMNDAGGL